jgi:hypothetical protein
MLSDGELSDDPNMVVIPVEDEKSDGNKSTWPVNTSDARFVYRIRDDEPWRIGLAQMWVEKQMGAALEEGMWHHFHYVHCSCLLVCLGTNLVLMDVSMGPKGSIMGLFQRGAWQ